MENVELSDKGNIAVKTKFTGEVDGKGGRNHLNNATKHILRQHKEDTLKNLTHPSFDIEQSKYNETLINQMEPGETMNKCVNRLCKERGIEPPKNEVNKRVRAVSMVLSIPTHLKNDKEKLKEFAKKTKEFLNTTDPFIGNVLLAQTNFDETQPHIEVIVLPHCKETNKLDFSKLFGTEYKKTWDPDKPVIDSKTKKPVLDKDGKPKIGCQFSTKISDGKKKLAKLHDVFAEKVLNPIGLKRGDGTHTKKLSNKAYAESIKKLNQDEKELIATEIPEPPKPIDKPSFKVLSNNKELVDKLEKENAQLRAYIKKTRNDRNMLRSSRGILKQSQARNKDRINLKNKIESQQAEIEKQKQIIVETFETDKPKQSEISAVRDKFKQMKRERELEEENKRIQEIDKQNKLNHKRFIEDLEKRNEDRKRLALEEQKKPVFRTPGYKPPGSNEKN